MNKNLPLPHELIPPVCIFNTHEDFEDYEAVYVGFDSKINLIILCEYSCYSRPEFDCGTYAILSPGEAFRLAKRLKVALSDLPAEIGQAMADWNEIHFAEPSDVRDCFKEITECLIDEGCRFRIARRRARNGYINC